MRRVASLFFKFCLFLVAIVGTLRMGSARPHSAAADDIAFAPTAEHIEYYEKQIKPILKANCYKCHGGKKIKGGFRMNSRQAILRGGELGPLSLDSPDENTLLSAIRYEDLEMPPAGKLPEGQIAKLTKWVELGMPFPPGEVGEDDMEKEGSLVTDADQEYWAYRPLARPDLPAIGDPAGLGNEIDAFVLSKLNAVGLAPAPRADRRTLIRRAYYDLIGLPPDNADVDAFVADSRDDAYPRLIDRLLASPQYGEKWGRHWLDLVRYAETNGYERDGPKANVWRYRDYVIRAFNLDKPYDRFVSEQIAGDELPDGDADAWIATGYQRLGLWDDEPADPVQAFYDSLDDVVSTTGNVFMGMTIGCARCHDHKIDPVPQRDYYRLMAFFNNTYKNIDEEVYKKQSFLYLTQEVIATEEQKREHRRGVAALRGQVRELEKQVEAFENVVYESFSNPEREDAKDRRTRENMIRDRAQEVLGDRFAAYQSVKKQHVQLRRKRIPELAQALVIKENGPRAPDTHVLVRGNAHAKGDVVQPGFPEVLGFDDPELPPSQPGDRTSGRRRELAKWLTDPDNPVTARVMVNRMWQHHFGRGLARSTNDFGKAGMPPTHGELLDWLASEFIARDWQIKSMHRLIMLSNTYQMAYVEDRDGLEKDPLNDLYWRFDMRRMTAEEVRDTVLQLAGVLNPQMAGPSVYTEIPAEVLHGASRPDAAWGKSPPGQRNRRSVYVHVKRSVREPTLSAFDAAETDSSCPVRFATTVPTQALSSLNGQFFNKMAGVFADRVRREAGEDVVDQITHSLHLALNRRPADSEVRRGVKLVDNWQEKDGIGAEKALEYFCLLVFNMNEVMYLD